MMTLLQRELGLEIVHLRIQEEQPRREPVDVVRRKRMRESLQSVADLIGRRTHWTVEGGLLTCGFPRWMRMLAMAAIVLDTGARVGEMRAIRLEDLSPALEEVRIVRRPRNARPNDPVSVEVYPLRRSTRAALQRWLLVRRLLMVDVTGTADALWVSVRGNHGGTVTPRQDSSTGPPAPCCSRAAPGTRNAAAADVRSAAAQAQVSQPQCSRPLSQ
ncbi:hypothetical protein ACFPN0_00580 [Kitasatospora cinereorecta]